MPSPAGFRRRSRPGFGLSSGFWRGRVWSLILLPALVLLLALARYKAFAIDEFLFLHWGAEAAQRRYAGADYFAIHFALVQFVLAPLFRFLDPSSAAPLLAARAIAFLEFLSAIAAALSLVAGRRRRLLGATLLLTTNVLLLSAVEVRPDLLSLSLLCGGAALFLRTTGKLPAFATGLLLGGAILSSEKALLHGLAFAATLAFGLWRARRMGRAKPELRRVLLAAAAVVAVLGVAAGLLYAADGLHQFGVWLEMARLHETAYPTARFAGLKELGQALAGAPFLLLAPIGAWHLARRARRENGGRQALCDAFVVAAALAGLLSVLLQRAPYSYSSMPLLLFGTLLAVEALALLYGALRRRLPAGARGRAAVVAGGLLALFLLGEFRRTVREISGPEQTRQLAALETLFRLTAPVDCVYDNSAFAYSRRHVDDFFLITDAMMRMALRRELAERIPAAIRERRCTVFKDDFRTHQLPRSLQKFLASHYIRIAPDVFLWGQSYAAGSARVRFEAIAEGEHYLWPESARFSTGGRTVTLPRGESTLEVVAPVGFSILWLPRDGRAYPPLAEATGEGFFSSRAPGASGTGSR